jgi:hypothetical protein
VGLAIELVPLASATLELGEAITLERGPFGTRAVFEMRSCVYEGERLRGRQKGVAAADWELIAPDGTGALDVRFTLETDDGALIYVPYQGRTDESLGGAAPIYAAPLFETGDERYGWLNKVQAVAKRTLDCDTLTYEIYEVR